MLALGQVGCTLVMGSFGLEARRVESVGAMRSADEFLLGAMEQKFSI